MAVQSAAAMVLLVLAYCLAVDIHQLAHSVSGHLARHHKAMWQVARSGDMHAGPSSFLYAVVHCRPSSFGPFAGPNQVCPAVGAAHSLFAYSEVVKLDSKVIVEESNSLVRQMRLRWLDTGSVYTRNPAGILLAMALRAVWVPEVF